MLLTCPYTYSVFFLLYSFCYRVLSEYAWKQWTLLSVMDSVWVHSFYINISFHDAWIYFGLSLLKDWNFWPQHSDPLFSKNRCSIVIISRYSTIIRFTIHVLFSHRFIQFRSYSISFKNIQSKDFLFQSHFKPFDAKVRGCFTGSLTFTQNIILGKICFSE